MEGDSICKKHGENLLMVCKTCNEFLCCKCIVDHEDQGCKSIISIATYVKRYQISKYKEIIESFRSTKSFFNEYILLFDSTIKKIKHLKLQLEELLKTLTNCIAKFDVDKESLINALEDAKLSFVDEYEALKKSLETNDMSTIINKIKKLGNDDLITKNDKEKRLLEFVDGLLLKITSTNQLETLSYALKKLESKKLNTTIYGNKCIYGVCQNLGDYRMLYKYSIIDKKLILKINVPKKCTVSQINDRIFISGGMDPTINSVSEYIEKSQTLVQKSSMNFPKYDHAGIFVYKEILVTIGGFNSNTLNYCEEYSIFEDKWSTLPSLNTARYRAGTAFLENKYLYAIGGYNSNNTIEMLDATTKKSWQTLNLLLIDVEFDKGPQAVTISSTEIFILCGYGTKTAIFNTENKSVKEQNITICDDYFDVSSTNIYKKHAYIIGEKGFLYIYDIDKRTLEQIKLST